LRGTGILRPTCAVLATFGKYKGGSSAGSEQGRKSIFRKERFVMTFPLSGGIQLMPGGPANLYVDSVSDPNGPPSNVLDVDRGFTVTGRVQLPNSFNGTGQVCIYADELGGKIDQSLSPCATIAVTADPKEPALKEYPWSITFPGDVLPDPSPGSQLYHLAAVFTFDGQLSDIAGFVDMGLYLIN
jgi:hypothetical protein